MTVTFTKQVAIFALQEAGETVDEAEAPHMLEYRLRKLAESDPKKYRRFSTISVVADDPGLERFRLKRL